MRSLEEIIAENERAAKEQAERAQAAGPHRCRWEQYDCYGGVWWRCSICGRRVTVEEVEAALNGHIAELGRQLAAGCEALQKAEAACAALRRWAQDAAMTFMGGAAWRDGHAQR